MDRLCKACGEPAAQRKAPVGRWPEYCSDSCRSTWYRIRQGLPATPRTSRPAAGVVRTCKGCAIELPPFDSRAERNPRIWCSDACRVRVHYEAKRARTGATPGYFPRSTVAFPTCSECSKIFTAKTPRARVCSSTCGLLRKARLSRERYAADPQTELQRFRRLRATQSDEKRDKNRARNQRRRAVVYGADAEKFLPSEIYDRDGWTCQLCLFGIDRALRFPDPWSPTIDHTTPLSLGGPHTRANVRAAHLHCNSARGNRVS